jgi:hypothetical protein
MQDKELYQPILGPASTRTVSGVKWDIPAEEITVLSANERFAESLDTVSPNDAR